MSRRIDIQAHDIGELLGEGRVVRELNLFRGAAEVSSGMADDVSDHGTVLFTLSAVGVSALARETDDGFVVLAGSTARKTGTEAFSSGYRALRDQLVQERRLVDGAPPDLYRFTSDVAFSSPSAAASVIAARSASGPREWAVKATGQTYRDWRAARLDAIGAELNPACTAAPTPFSGLPPGSTPPSGGLDHPASRTLSDGM
jgi:hypothetical protein